MEKELIKEAKLYRKNIYELITKWLDRNLEVEERKELKKLLIDYGKSEKAVEELQQETMFKKKMKERSKETKPIKSNIRVWKPNN